ncbi:hypothetical protein [Salinisphaera sp. G21_0]|uniref:hypothetical protein n=1 Tax=Salinisphaera sp. G21_0 TaxID=2821094 RepID=UPI001ADB74C8|nr:hypothetical protein [Salinisphaera sp. G21_0]MBO9480882.1 hypothetical protein [Salinisphaera sp. G21_0]
MKNPMQEEAHVHYPQELTGTEACLLIRKPLKNTINFELVDGITCMLEANLKTSFPKDLTITLSSLGVKSGTLDEA